jgi:hypothetical protein
LRWFGQCVRPPLPPRALPPVENELVNPTCQSLLQTLAPHLCHHTSQRRRSGWGRRSCRRPTSSTPSTAATGQHRQPPAPPPLAVSRSVHARRWERLAGPCPQPVRLFARPHLRYVRRSSQILVALAWTLMTVSAILVDGQQQS